MSNSPFPTYDTHSQVHCFNCDHKLDDTEEVDSGYFYGTWRKQCSHCTHFTFYDLEPDPDAEFNARVDWEMDKRND